MKVKCGPAFAQFRKSSLAHSYYRLLSLNLCYLLNSRVCYNSIAFDGLTRERSFNVSISSGFFLPFLVVIKIDSNLIVHV